MFDGMLWHYRSLDTATRHILPSGGRLQLGAFIRMRDPRESKTWDPAITGTRTVGERDREHEQIRAALDQIRRRAKILSLTRDDDPMTDNVYERGFARPRLWEAYGSRAEGGSMDYRAVCLGFDGPELLAAIRASLTAQDVPASEVYTHPVVYRDSPVSITLAAAEIDVDGVRSAVDSCIHRELAHLFFTKLLDWETEREFRALAMTADASDAAIRVDFGGSLRDVYAGNLSEPELDALTEVVRASRPGVEVHALDWVNSTPRPRPIWLNR